MPPARSPVPVPVDPAGHRRRLPMGRRARPVEPALQTRGLFYAGARPQYSTTVNNTRPTPTVQGLRFPLTHSLLPLGNIGCRMICGGRALRGGDDDRLVYSTDEIIDGFLTCQADRFAHCRLVPAYITRRSSLDCLLYQLPCLLDMVLLSQVSADRQAQGVFAAQHSVGEVHLAGLVQPFQQSSIGLVSIFA